MRAIRFAAVPAVALSAFLALDAQNALADSAGNPTSVVLDLRAASTIALPQARDLKPVRFKTEDGRGGWAVRLSPNGPIPTPAFAEGRIYVGGSMGSRDFYALDAKTGEVAWKVDTKDNGPTSAVVEDGLVVFNTESCTTMAVTASTGHVVWNKWISSVVMSLPTIAKGRVYTAAPQTGSLICFDLKTGNSVWEQRIARDVISAPVIDGDHVFFTCVDGTSWCLDAEKGSVVWRKTSSGSSAPTVSGGQVYTSTAGTSDGTGIQHFATKGDGEDESSPPSPGTTSSLPTSSLPTGVVPTGDVQPLVGTWGYQGARPSIGNGRVMSALDNYVYCVRELDGKTLWRAKVSLGKDGEGEGLPPTGERPGRRPPQRGPAGMNAPATSFFSPPSLGKKNLYLASTAGHLACMSQRNGSTVFNYKLNDAIPSQPALSLGNVYFGTANGLLVCLETGDDDASGWTAWGGSGGRNGSADRRAQTMAFSGADDEATGSDDDATVYLPKTKSFVNVVTLLADCADAPAKEIKAATDRARAAIDALEAEGHGRDACLFGPLARLLSNDPQLRELARARLNNLAGKSLSENEARGAAAVYERLRAARRRNDPAPLLVALASDAPLPIRAYAANGLAGLACSGAARDVARATDELASDANLATRAGGRCARAYGDALIALVRGTLPELPRQGPIKASDLKDLAREARAVWRKGVCDAAEHSLAAYAARHEQRDAWIRAQSEAKAAGNAALARLVEIAEEDSARAPTVFAVLKALTGELIPDEVESWKAYLESR